MHAKGRDVTFASNLQRDLVSDAGGRPPLVFDPETSVREVIGALRHHQSGTAVVCEQQRPIGIFTERDAIRLIAAASDMSMPIRDVMISPVETIAQSASVSEAIRLMEQGGYRRLPIVDEHGVLVGLVRVTGIVHYFVDHFPETVLNLAEPKGAAEREGA